MIPSAIDQRATVLMKRQIKTERGVTAFASGRSSVVGIYLHHPNRNEFCPQITQTRGFDIEVRFSGFAVNPRNLWIVFLRAKDDAGRGEGQS
jgi:hypothetical protein